VGIPYLGVGLVSHRAAQGVNSVFGGLGVPGFSVVEGDSLAEGEPPPVGIHLLKTSETSGDDISVFRPKESERLGYIMHYLIGVKGITMVTSSLAETTPVGRGVGATAAVVAVGA
jgi:hypothetical protein